MNEIYKSEKQRSKGDDINLTVYITVIDEDKVSPEQKAAIDRWREVYSEWLKEDEGTNL